MSIFGRLFGTKKAIDDLVDKENGLLAQVGGWVGNFSYTDEDKAEADERTRQWGLQQLAAIGPFKVVQRILAFVTAGLWAFVGLNIVVAIWVHAVTKTTKLVGKELVTTSIDARTDLMAFAFSDYVLWPVLAVFSLYFTGGVVNSFLSKGKPDA